MLRRSAVALLFAVGRLYPANDALFRDRILPVLQTHCSSCHTGATSASNLSIASLESLLQGGKHGPALTPGDSRRSVLIQHLRGERSPKMPLGGSLPDPTIADLAAAIDAMQPLPQASKPGNDHAAWLFQPPKPQSPNHPITKSHRRLHTSEARGQGPDPGADCRPPYPRPPRLFRPDRTASHARRDAEFFGRLLS